MSRAADDLAALFAPAPTGPGQPVTFRQGTVLTYDNDTSANTIDVGGSILTNLPVLEVAVTPILAPGDSVALLVVGPMMAIIGRFVTP